MAPRKKKESVLCCSSCRLLHSTEVKRCRHCAEPNPRAPSALLLREQRWRLQRRPARWRFSRLVDLLFIALLVLAPFETDRRDPSWTIPVLFVLLGAWVSSRLVHAFVARHRLSRVARAPKVTEIDGGGGEGAPDFEGTARRAKETVSARLSGKRCLATECWLTSADRLRRVRLRRSEAASFSVEDGDQVWVVEGAIRLVGSPTRSVDTAEGASSSLGLELESVWTEGGGLHELCLDSRDRVALRGGKRRAAQADPRVRRKHDEVEVTVVQGISGDPVWVEVLKKGGPAG